MEGPVFAVVEIKGFQHKLALQDQFMVDRLEGSVGQELSFDQVLLLGSQHATIIGRPCIPAAQVRCIIEEHTETGKILAFKKRRRKHGSKRLKGHRSQVTILRVSSIQVPDHSQWTDALK